MKTSELIRQLRLKMAHIAGAEEHLNALQDVAPADDPTASDPPPPAIPPGGDSE